MFQLKNYQENTLEVLQKYLEESKFYGAEEAFHKFYPQYPYKKIETLEETPYVCLRLPTGGGKTYLATHSIGVASKTYLEQEYPVVLWFTPTTTIKTQTIETLKNPLHPNRELLEKEFCGNVAIFDIEDYVNVRPQDLNNKCCIFVSTFQTFRITDTNERRIYAHNENLEPHFAKVTRQQEKGLERIKEGSDAGKIKYSFANLLNLYRPLVIADEAHNNSTALGYEVLKRVNPSCIIEYTATPAKNSNVLHNVVAMELKAEEMIKLPIILTEHQSWQESVSASILAREGLAEKAKSDEKYIRPIVLIQAENEDKEITVDVIKNYLINEENIEPEKIAVATGEQKELDGINVLDENCKIEYIITKQALKEGWDCPFAYIFCSVAKTRSTKDVEQLLGRVLRMPYAKLRTQEELNKAYAFVSTTTWTDAVKMLHDRLVDMGFEENEAEDAIQAVLPVQTTELSFKPKPISFNVSDINLNNFTEEQKKQLEVIDTPVGKRVTVKSEEPISEEFESKIISSVPEKERKSVKVTIEILRRNQAVYSYKSPAEQGEKFIMPQLSLFIDGEWDNNYDEYFIDPMGKWLLDYPAKLTASEFRVTKVGETYEIDLHGTKIKERYLQQSFAFDLNDTQTDWTVAKLAIWMTRQLPKKYLSQQVQLSFTRQLIENLLLDCEITLNDLLRTKFVLVQAIDRKIEEYKKEAQKAGMQKTLFAPTAQLQTNYDFSIDFSGKIYTPLRIDRGSIKYNKHFFREIHEMNNEERECAFAIDKLEETKYWIRNIEKHDYSFSIPTATGNFYPDFIVELKDGRKLVVEYKGEHLLQNEDTKEKEAVGLLWEKASNGKCLFVIGVKNLDGKNIEEQILDKIG